MPAQPVSSAGTRDLVVNIGTGCIRQLTITGIVGSGGALTGLQLTAAAVNGGTHVPLLTDSDFATATDTLLRSLNLSAPTNIPAGTAFQFTVDLFSSIAEVELRCNSSLGTTVAIEATGFEG